jgi:hypothetical protein
MVHCTWYFVQILYNVPGTKYKVGIRVRIEFCYLKIMVHCTWYFVQVLYNVPSTKYKVGIRVLQFQAS